MPHLCLIGYGYTARFMAAYAQGFGWQVSATSRDPATRAQMQAMGITPLVFGEDLPEGVTHLLDTTPPQEGKSPFLTHYAATLRARGAGLWLGYCSTTGVYGDTKGAVVDENAPLRATSARGLARIAVEKAYQAAWPQTTILRLSGLYGPTLWGDVRSVIGRLQQGTQTMPTDTHMVNRIYIGDVVQALWLLMVQDVRGMVLNVCDDVPCPTAETVRYACALLGIDPESLPQKESAWQAEGSRIVCNKALKAVEGMFLSMPSYREGLLALYEEACATA